MRLQKSIAFCLFLGSVFVLPGCFAVIGTGSPHPHHSPHKPPSERHVCAPGGPPPWAPAHGYRRKCRYQYYPRVEVYYSVSVEIYFWKEGGEWVSGAHLPEHITIQGYDSVSLELTTDRPYEQHEEVRQKYGPKRPGEQNGKGPPGPPKHPPGKR